MRDNQTSAARTPAEPGLERARGGRKHKARRQGQAKKKRSGPLNLELVASESSSERRPGQTDAQPQPWASKGELTPELSYASAGSIVMPSPAVTGIGLFPTAVFCVFHKPRKAQRAAPSAFHFSAATATTTPALFAVIGPSEHAASSTSASSVTLSRILADLTSRSTDTPDLITPSI
ncbi:uncharacterized protein PAN0_003c1475 [Moesziomyces antarcticus]|uniref:uncharacterized protein n=1 Tax=Pseudozyma antarctica TaxID=84753 RepID=UPI0007195C78|nr:uncharacterized protein PAN0_003c1475 [Moesziomyces antarcticus]GAK63271.1 hypothetical protein PAN0_003c1475 [Moesziomyces antarcticus]